MPPFTTDEAARLTSIGALLREAPIALRHVTSTFSWEPTSASDLNREYHDSESGPGGPWGPIPVELGKRHVQFWLIIAARELGGLGTLYLNDDLIGSPWPVCRSVIESCAAAGWLLEPAEVRERVARAALVELEDLRHAKNAAAHALGLDPGVALTPERVAYEEYRDITIPGLFSNCLLAGKGEQHIDGQVFPNYSTLAGNLVDRHLRGGSGREVYGYLCARTHPTSTAYISLFEPDGGRRRPPSQVRPPRQRRTARPHLALQGVRDVRRSLGLGSGCGHTPILGRPDQRRVPGRPYVTGRPRILTGTGKVVRAQGR